MGNVIKFPKKIKGRTVVHTKSAPLAIKNMTMLNGVEVEKPQTKAQYLLICKQFLDKPTYQAVLCGVLDDEYYSALEPKLQSVVSSYYEFKA